MPGWRCAACARSTSGCGGTRRARSRSRAGWTSSRRSRACSIRRCPTAPATSIGRATSTARRACSPSCSTGGDAAARDRLIDGLELFGIGYSWGGFESLAVPADPTGPHRDSAAEGRGPLSGSMIGLEDPDDLIADLAAGADRLPGGMIERIADGLRHPGSRTLRLDRGRRRRPASSWPSAPPAGRPAAGSGRALAHFWERQRRRPRRRDRAAPVRRPPLSARSGCCWRSRSAPMPGRRSPRCCSASPPRSPPRLLVVNLVRGLHLPRWSPGCSAASPSSPCSPTRSAGWSR